MDISAAISVSTLIACIQELVEDNFVEVLVRGELSNVSQPASGHYYFTLKDNKAQVRCAMFRSHARVLRFKPEDGLAVICRGRVSVYPQRGDLQLIVEAIEPEGVGSLQLAFDQLKEKLQAEGLFAEKFKQSLPAFPKTIGIVTSATGAAIQDILNVLQRRSAGLRVLLRSVRVQGEGAAQEIALAIQELNQEASSDVLIIGRGGGSREDLWAFNEEVVARAIHASRIPVISAVGHEIDFSISDLVADLRAPTPSAAAELVVKNRLDLERHLDQLCLRLADKIRSQLLLIRSQLQGLEKRLQAPEELIRRQRLHFQHLEARQRQAMSGILKQQQQRFAILTGQLEALSPLAVLSRGYAIVTDLKTGSILEAPTQVTEGDELLIRLAKGEIAATVAPMKRKNAK
ncbi:MAG: exodeoxyribonuclease VII large subunit [Deltaproteobacteria bacterium]|nr:exodeoxyribonuclease VII large subunit [Deltaproteobacteria bacterium]MCW9049337.1 exodeoxyribonuclease VII large subunit [Deltaproteobacteria bacterium]